MWFVSRNLVLLAVAELFVPVLDHVNRLLAFRRFAHGFDDKKSLPVDRDVKTRPCLNAKTGMPKQRLG